MLKLISLLVVLPLLRWGLDLLKKGSMIVVSSYSRDKLTDTNVSSFNFEGFVGYQWQNFEYSGAYVSGGDFVTDVVKYNNFDFAQDFDQGEGTVSSYKNTHKLIGFYARANLDWDRTYYFNVSARREGSTRFGKDNKWGLFWSVGGGVELTNL